MKTLFYMILGVTLIAVRLIAPNSFRNNDEYTEMIQNLSDDPVIQEVTTIQREIATVSAAATAQTVIEPVNTAAPEIPVQNTGNSDPMKMLEAPKITDNFEQGSSAFGINAGLNDDESIRIIALNNKLSLEPKKNNGWLTWRLRPPVFKDGAAELEFSITTCARGDRTGLMLHASDYTGGHGYYFSLACEGTVSILMDSIILGSADARNLFKNNSGETNIMTAMASGGTLTLMLNGQQALSVQDSTYTEGFSGFFTAPQNQGSLTMDIQSFKIYYDEQQIRN